MSEYRSLVQKCIIGSHILHYHGILDAYGHLSFRHPTKADVFIMPRDMAPANVAGQGDLVEYSVADASAIDANAPPGYIERFIHSEIYKRFPGINSVIHSHASAVIPYTITGVPLKPCIHMAGFLGPATPVFDIEEHYESTSIRDLLIRSPNSGQALAACFDSPKEVPDHSVVLMRGHGYTTAARGIEECVFRALYARENAAIQTAAIELATAHRGKSVTQIQYLYEGEIEDASKIAVRGWKRAWGLWVREVEVAGLYTFTEDG